MKESGHKKVEGRGKYKKIRERIKYYQQKIRELELLDMEGRV